MDNYRRHLRQLTFIIASLFVMALSLPVQAAYEKGPATGFECDGLSVPAFDGNIVQTVNGNVTSFTEEEKSRTESYEEYSPLDSLGRCTRTEANIGTDLMPKEGEKREDLNTKPTGWVNNKYDTSIVSGGYVFNRSHLIGWQLTAENDNKLNLITGTRALNVKGMLFYENQVAKYLKANPENHVMYRVIPYFEGDNLLSYGVLMEMESVEDEEINSCVFVYNIQPGIVFDYSSGENRLEDESAAKTKVSSLKVSIVSKKVYTGKKIKPSVKVTDSGKTLKAGEDYTLAYGTNRALGKGSVKITGKGKYSGTRTVYFYIIPKKQAITAVKGAKKSMKLKWTKAPGASGYQIKYRIRGKKYSKTTRTSNSAVIKKLKRGKVYEVKVRTYKKVSGKTLYGAFSKVKKVKIK